VNGVSFYGLFGPGVAPGGQMVSGAATFTATGVPAGNQQWSVGSFYSPGNISTPAAAFPTVTLNVTGPAPVPPPPAAATPAQSGRYLVTVTGLRAYQASVDDILSRDGVGDEVYAAAYVRRYDRRTAQVVDAASLKTLSYGDVNQFGTQRVQAGSRSPTGGIRDGDPVPDGPLVAVRTLPAQAVTFPWKVWEGTLTDGVDALVISPTIWEQDGGTSYYTQWEQQQQTLNVSLFSRQSIQDQIAQKLFGTLVAGVSGVNSGAAAQIQLRNVADLSLMMFGLPIPVANLLSTSADRPIGVVPNTSAPDQTLMPIHTVVLTREIIEGALTQPALGMVPSPIIAPTALVGAPAIALIPVLAPQPGILVIGFQDGLLPGFLGADRPAIYQMFIQVERLP
jgi:hypothetical protein